MRYTVRGLEIRSENAAKPASSAGHWVLKWIRSLPTDATCLDLGCGKLRYTVPLAKRLACVTAVDSSIQVERKQFLFGKRCSVREYASGRLPNVAIYCVNQRSWRRRRYKFILCSNVLSAVPCHKTRKAILCLAFSCLAREGKLLLTTQYRNSHFDKWKHEAHASRYMDGFVVKRRGRATFYGMLDATALSLLCKKSGFTIVDKGHVKELAYVLASKS